MKWKTIGITVASLLIVLLCLAGWRWWQVLGYPMGGGSFKASPDNRYTASADTLVDRKFFGRERTYYEFSLYAGTNALTRKPRVRSFEIIPLSEPFINWRGQGAIEWTADSSEARFKFGESIFTLKAPQ